MTATAIDGCVRQLEALSREECLRRLAEHSFGRLAVNGSGGVPVVRPVNYWFDPSTQSVIIRTVEGSKLVELLHLAHAAFEVDEIDERARTGWSVLVAGRAEEITRAHERERLHDRGALPWAPGKKQHLVRIRAATVSGRAVIAGGRAPERA